MNSMAIDRRDFLIGSVIAVGAAGGHAFARDTTPAAFASACRRANGSYAIVLITASGRIVKEIAIAARAHDIAWSAVTGRAVAFARQPGEFAVAFEPGKDREPVLFAPPDNRCFFGHGVFSSDGRLLYTTENDIDLGLGCIGVYDAGAGFRRVGEFASGGVGPHELILLDDGETLAIANGGYETLPATGRQAIDIAGMQPSLVFIDRRHGTVLARHDQPRELAALSIRHLAVDADGRVWFGCQWEGSPDAAPAVIGRASRDSAPLLIQAEAASGAALKGYVGSLAMSRDGRTLAASAPRAARIVYIDVASGRLSSETRLADGCGIAASGDGFTISSGHGRLISHQSETGDLTLSVADGMALDNHLRALPRRV